MNKINLGGELRVLDRMNGRYGMNRWNLGVQEKAVDIYIEWEQNTVRV